MQLVGCNWPALEKVAKHSAERNRKRRRIGYPGKFKHRDTLGPQGRPLQANSKQRQAQFEDESRPGLPGGESTHEQHGRKQNAEQYASNQTLLKKGKQKDQP